MPSRAQRVTYSALFAVLMVVGAYLKVPLLQVPLTLQTFFVYLSGLLLDPTTAASAQAIYLLMGLTGLPVFAGPLVGPQAFVGPTGGFLLSFPIAALVEAALSSRRSRMSDVAGLLSAFVVIFGMGLTYFMAYFSKGEPVGVLTAFLPFMLWDGVKMALAYVVAGGVRKFVRQRITSGRP